MRWSIRGDRTGADDDTRRGRRRRLGAAEEETDGAAGGRRGERPDSDKPSEPPADPFRGEVPALTIVPAQDRRFTDKVIRLAEHRPTAGQRQGPFARRAQRLPRDRRAAEERRRVERGSPPATGTTVPARDAAGRSGARRTGRGRDAPIAPEVPEPQTVDPEAEPTGRHAKLRQTICAASTARAEAVPPADDDGEPLPAGAPAAGEDATDPADGSRNNARGAGSREARQARNVAARLRAMGRPAGTRHGGIRASRRGSRRAVGRNPGDQSSETKDEAPRAEKDDEPASRRTPGWRSSRWSRWKKPRVSMFRRPSRRGRKGPPPTPSSPPPRRIRPGQPARPRRTLSPAAKLRRAQATAARHHRGTRRQAWQGSRRRAGRRRAEIRSRPVDPRKAAGARAGSFRRHAALRQ